MIWIGKSYKKILCRQKGSCGIPVKNKLNKCFVHEAEWRGCCRKIPNTPEWVVPGKSKIFLIHSDNFKSKEKGKIFGYFVLERVEMIRPPQKVMPLEVNPTSPLQIKRLKKLQQEDEKILVLKGTVYRADTGKPLKGVVIDAEIVKGQDSEKTVTDENGVYKFMLAVGQYCVKVSAQCFETQVCEGIELSLNEKSEHDFYLTPEKCLEGQELSRTCWDGPKIVTHKCKDGKWQPTGEIFPEPQEQHNKTKGCKEGKELIQECWDGSKIVTHRCENGTWVATNKKCPGIPESPYEPNGSNGYDHEPISVPIDTTMFESHRSCSLRFKPGSIYLVDALTADVTDTFNREILKSGIWKDYKKAASDAARKACIKQGNRLFKDILTRFRKTRIARTKIPSFIKAKAELRGELVLFNDPPIYENHPRVSFLGIRRINGDELLQQIVDRVLVPEIPYYFPKETPRRIIISELSKELRINQAASERGLNRLIEVLTNGIKEKGELRIWGFGTFKIIHLKARKGRNPRTGEEIQITAKNTVRFNPAKALKEAVKRVPLTGIKNKKRKRRN